MTPNDDSPTDFEVTASFRGDVVVLGVRGEVDIATAPHLGALLDAVIDQRHTSIALDLAELDFMGSTGLDVIASVVNRLGAVGEDLTIRSAPTLVIRLLEISGLSDQVRFEEPAPDLDGPDPQETSGSPPVQTTFGVDDATARLRQATALPADHHVVDSALQLVASLARATVAGANGVSVSLRRHGRLATVAATDQTVLDMDTGQYATGEGPCVDASNEGRSLHMESLDQETRWPSFTPKARELGIAAILSNPLLIEERPFGALNIYSRTAAAFSEREQQLAAIFASEASLLLGNAGTDASDDELSERLQETLKSRQVIARAEGVVMEREGVSADDAYRRLVDFSRIGSQPLRQHAADVVDSARRPEPNPPSQNKGRVMSAPTSDVLDRARQDAGLTHGELWLRYFQLGGMSTALQVEAFCYGALEPSDHDHDVVAHALNERFVELGGNHPVAYSDQGETDAGEDTPRPVE